MRAGLATETRLFLFLSLFFFCFLLFGPRATRIRPRLEIWSWNLQFSASETPWEPRYGPISKISTEIRGSSKKSAFLQNFEEFLQNFGEFEQNFEEFEQNFEEFGEFCRISKNSKEFGRIRRIRIILKNSKNSKNSQNSKNSEELIVLQSPAECCRL